MAHALTLTDGTTTIDLTTTHRVRDYEQASFDSAKSYQDGEPEITETLNVTVFAATGPLLQTAVNAIELLLAAANRRNDVKSPLYKMGPRVYLTMQIDGEASAWRAEILNGHFQPDKEMLKIGWPNRQADGALLLTHRVWEGPRKELSISSNGFSAQTGGIPITNTPASNWIQIASSQIGGALPTPLEIQITNTSGSARSYRNFYLANNAFSDPTHFVHGIGAGSISLSLVSGWYTGQIIYTLSPTAMQDTQGRMFRLLARLTTLSNGTYITPRIRDNSGAAGEILAEGDEVYVPTLNTSWVDLGALPLPPGGYYDTWQGVTLSLGCRSVASGTVAVNLLQLTPMDSYQYIIQRGLTVGIGTIVLFDNIEQVYTVANGPIYSPRSGPLIAWPGITQRVMILYDEGTSSTTTQTVSVRVYVRERRLTV